METEIIASLQLILNKYGRPLAEQVEKLVRNETTHFTSKGWLNDYCPGMESFNSAFPYGYSSAADFWKANQNYAPIAIVDKVENSSAMMSSRGTRHFLKFKTVEAALMTVAFIINKRGGDGGSWFSVSDLVSRAKYNRALDLIKAKFVASIK